MTFIQLFFIFIAAATLGAALLVVTTRNLIHAALWLIVSLFGVAVFYVILNAGFLAMVQVVIYIGAIAILMIFAIMLTRKVSKVPKPAFNSNWIWALLIAVVMFGSMTWILNMWPQFEAIPTAIAPSIDPLRLLGAALVSPEAYVLPFELASLLLLAALIGAIVVAWESR